MYPGMNFGSGLFGGMPQFGGYMPQFGGMPQYGGYMPQMGGFGGYNPYQQMSMNPYGYGMYGGGMFAPGFLDQFQGQLNDMFSKYFGEPAGVTPEVSSISGTMAEEQPGATPAPPAEPETSVQTDGPTNVGPSTKPYADITGKYYGKTGQLSQGAQQKAIDAYGSMDAFWASEQGQQMQNQRNRRGGKDVNKSSL